jgi:hypothetical protein
MLGDERIERVVLGEVRVGIGYGKDSKTSIF